MKRTVVPVLIVSLFGSNEAWLVPLPVIFTSTTAPAGSAVGAGVAASAWDAADFFSPPQATAVNATSVVSRVNRIANRSEEHTSELQSQSNLVCRLLLEKKKNKRKRTRSVSPVFYMSTRVT